jgi:hypothetical protein
MKSATHEEKSTEWKCVYTCDDTHETSILDASTMTMCENGFSVPSFAGVNN